MTTLHHDACAIVSVASDVVATIDVAVVAVGDEDDRGVLVVGQSDLRGVAATRGWVLLELAEGDT